MRTTEPPPTGPSVEEAGTLDAAWICTRYESARASLPEARFPESSRTAQNLLALAHEFDAFLLDAFGVLNVGMQAIPGATEAISALQAAGKATLVLTNGATLTAADALAKYRDWGFHFDASDVISSRDLLCTAMRQMGEEKRWGVAASHASRIEQLPARCEYLHDSDGIYDEADGFVLLSTHGWTEARQQRLHDALSARPRPLLVGNPDVVAPREQGFSLEPGHFAHQLTGIDGVQTRFFGKPFGNAYEEAFRRLAARNQLPHDRRRIAMVGDSLHTDILGGAAAGCRTVLVTDHGLFRDSSPERFCAQSGIVPDFIVPTT